MKKVISIFLVAISSFTILTSCNSNDDLADNTSLEGSGITITDDVDCCSAEEALQVYKFIQQVKIIPELQFSVDDKYNVFGYSRTGSLHTGYNDIYFVATKKSSGNYIKDFDITDITPIMTMGEMNNMRHSTPVSSGIASFNEGYLAVKKGWISFLMPSSQSNTWTLSYTASILGKKAVNTDISLVVDSLAEGQSWLKSFKYGDDTYIISLVNPTDWIVGSNTISAYVSEKSSPITEPYSLADEQFIIDVYPEMPDMGGHTSPDNTPLTQQSDATYQGNVNLTMTGLWRLHLTIKDSSGNIIAGGDNTKDGFSSLYFDVTL